MEFHVSLVGRSDLSGEIYRQVRDAIRDGRLRPGDRLPPTRELARGLSVARTTVTTAYERLTGEGFVLPRVGAGTFVGDHVAKVPTTRERIESPLRPRRVWSTIAPSTAFARQAAFDFRSGLPDAALFPYEAWRRLMSHQLRATTAKAGVYADPAGDRGLREAIARRLGASRGMVASANDVTVTNGTQQALDLVARVLLAPGDRVAVEDPGYRPAHLAFRAIGARVDGVPVDEHGLVVDALRRQTRLVYVTPTHQYPLGMTMTRQRRMALLAWAARHDAAIIEDDYDSEFRFGGRPLEPLHTLDTLGRVIYVGSFSKTMLPVLRLGFLLTPPTLTKAVHAAKYVTDWHTSLPQQVALARFIDDGGFASHIRKMARVYQARHALVTRELARQFADHLELIPSVVGLHVSAVARRLSAEQIGVVVRRCADVGVQVQALAEFGVNGPARPGLLLGYGAIPTSHIEEGIRRIRSIFDG